MSYILLWRKYKTPSVYSQCCDLHEKDLFVPDTSSIHSSHSEKYIHVPLCQFREFTTVIGLHFELVQLGVSWAGANHIFMAGLRGNFS